MKSIKFNQNDCKILHLESHKIEIHNKEHKNKVKQQCCRRGPGISVDHK